MALLGRDLSHRQGELLTAGRGGVPARRALADAQRETPFALGVTAALDGLHVGRPRLLFFGTVVRGDAAGPSPGHRGRPTMTTRMQASWGAHAFDQG